MVSQARHRGAIEAIVRREGTRAEAPMREHAPMAHANVLNDAGVDTLYDCRRVECGLCTLDIVRVEGRIDHRDVFFSPHEKQSSQRLCACVSRVTGGGVVLDSAYRAD